MKSLDGTNIFTKLWGITRGKLKIGQYYDFLVVTMD